MAEQWGWSGPRYVDGYLSHGHHAVHLRYLDAYNAWLDEHPDFDWLADFIKRNPDMPWPPQLDRL